jgi:hypothetical protein
LPFQKLSQFNENPGLPRTLVLGFIGWEAARIGRIDSQSDIESCQIGRVMKMQSLAGLVCIVFLGTGCATSHIAHEAKDHCVADPQTGQTTIVPGNKMAWAMAPATVGWDVATSPILGLGVLWLWATKFSG